MRLRFLIDAQLPIGMARWLEKQGHDARHAFEVALHSATDRAIWDYASSSGAIIVSKDSDFVQLSVGDIAGPSVVWVRFGNVTTATLITALEQTWPQILSALEAGERLVEVRR